MVYYFHIISDRACHCTVAFILFDTKCFILIMSRLVVFASRPVEQFLSMLKSQHVVACFAVWRVCLCCLPLLDVELVWSCYASVATVSLKVAACARQ